MLIFCDLQFSKNSFNYHNFLLHALTEISRQHVHFVDRFTAIFHLAKFHSKECSKPLNWNSCGVGRYLPNLRSQPAQTHEIPFDWNKKNLLAAVTRVMKITQVQEDWEPSHLNVAVLDKSYVAFCSFSDTEIENSFSMHLLPS